MTEKTQINRQDKKILETLQNHCRVSAQELSEQVHMSSATCWRRMKALEDNGVISGYKAILDRKSLGFEICAFVNVYIDHSDPALSVNIQKAFEEKPEVLECYSTTGESDYILRVIAKDIADLDLLLKSFLSKLPGIKQIRSTVALDEIKQTTQLPV